MADTEDLDIDLNAEEETPQSELALDDPAQTPDGAAKLDAPEVTKTASETISPEDAIKTLKQSLEQEKSARLEAENRARIAQQNASKATLAAEDSNLQLINSAISQVTQENSYHKANYAAALANQDYTAAAEIQEAMSTNAAKLIQLQAGKEAMEKAPKQSPVTRETPSDPVEALASQLSPRSAAWIRRNPQFATDQRMNANLIAAHNLAVAKYAADSDEYFRRVEELLELRGSQAPIQEDDSALSSASAPIQRRSSPPAAPVSRSSNGMNGTKPNIVRLTAEQREIAAMNGMTDKEYAKHLLALKAEGKIN